MQFAVFKNYDILLKFIKRQQSKGAANKFLTDNKKSLISLDALFFENLRDSGTLSDLCLWNRSTANQIKRRVMPEKETLLNRR
jgi:hypothetical protein